MDDDETRSYEQILEDSEHQENTIKVLRGQLAQARSHPRAAVYQRQSVGMAESAWAAGAAHVANMLNNLTEDWDIPLDVKLDKDKISKEFESWKAKQKQ